MNKAEQKLISMINHIDYDYLMDNKDENEKTGYAYERIIAEILEEKGLTNLRKVEKFKFTAPVIKAVRVKGRVQEASDSMPDNSFKLAPFGERSPVDLIIKMDGRVIALECKSTTGGIPEWNDNPPKEDFLYAFNLKGFPPTFKMGKDIISYDDRKTLLTLAETTQRIGQVFSGSSTEDLTDIFAELKSLYETGYRTDDKFTFYVRKKFDQTDKSFRKMMNAV